MVMLNGRHWGGSVKMVRDKYGVEWCSEPLHMRYAYLVDGNPISSAQEIKLSKIENILTATTRRKATFKDRV